VSATIKFRVVERDAGRAFLYLACEHGCNHGGGQRECAFGLWTSPARNKTWQWDGNVERPTITPSIDCQGGCGRHFTMVNGVPT
jgi:hypothetical protein